MFLHINSHHVGTPLRVEMLAESEMLSQAIFSVDSEALRDGWNILRLGSSDTVTVLSLEIVVG